MQIKDVANTVGVRDNQLIGYGLVVGLNGSGDGTSSKFTLQSISNLLQGKNIIKTLMDSSFNLLLMIDKARSVPKFHSKQKNLALSGLFLK